MLGSPEGADGIAAVRALRAGPPGRAADGRRGKTFGAALDQFEQLLVAARRVPPVSAPILLFPALAQAGRAILAAHATQGWEVHGHGLSVVTEREPIGATTVAPSGSGLFQAVASVTRSGPLTGAVKLSEVWGAIPHLPRETGLGLGEPPIFMISQEPPGGLRRIVRDERGTLLRDAGQFIAQDGRHPAIGSAEISTRQQSGFVVVELEFPGAAEAREFDGGLWEYLGGSYLRQAPGGALRELSGLTTWWILLQALSHVARYEPAGWTRALTPDRSRLTVPIEETLRLVTRLLPRLVLEALHTEP